MRMRTRKLSPALITLGLIAVLCIIGDLRTNVSAFAADLQRLDGSWLTTVTATNPPGLPPFKELMTFTLNGEVMESRRLYVPFTPFGPVLETPGHGAWERTGHGEFAVTFMFLVQAAPNNPIFVQGDDLGTDNIRMRLTLDASGESFTGIFMSTAHDPDGNAVFTATGTVVGTRLHAQPLP